MEIKTVIYPQEPKLSVYIGYFPVILIFHDEIIEKVAEEKAIFTLRNDYHDNLQLHIY